MGFSYLRGPDGDRLWADITREERFFCAHLFGLVRQGDGRQEFVDFLCGQSLEVANNGPWINTRLRESLKSTSDWEVGYEVCLYRDLNHAPKPNQPPKLPEVRDAINQQWDKPGGQRYLDRRPWDANDNPSLDANWKGLLKRTFDLCLFSEAHVVIIEAKAQQGFDNRQLDAFERDRAYVGAVLNRGHEVPHVQVHLLALTAGSYLKGAKKETRDRFESGGWITWASLAGAFGDDPVLKRAESTYGGAKP